MELPNRSKKKEGSARRLIFFFFFLMGEWEDVCKKVLVGVFAVAYQLDGPGLANFLELT